MEANKHCCSGFYNLHMIIACAWQESIYFIKKISHYAYYIQDGLKIKLFTFVDAIHVLLNRQPFHLQ